MDTSVLSDEAWRKFLSIARRLLGRGASQSWASESWCAWTTFSSLEHHLTYWKCGLPEEAELLETGTSDGGTWMQPFMYSDLAHFILPAKFYWERIEGPGGFQNGYKFQDIRALSRELEVFAIPHRLTQRVLEIKLY